jgi:hypothetical protein
VTSPTPRSTIPTIIEMSGAFVWSQSPPQRLGHGARWLSLGWRGDRSKTVRQPSANGMWRSWCDKHKAGCAMNRAPKAPRRGAQPEIVERDSDVGTMRFFCDYIRPPAAARARRRRWEPGRVSHHGWSSNARRAIMSEPCHCGSRGAVRLRGRWVRLVFGAAKPTDWRFGGADARP